MPTVRLTLRIGRSIVDVLAVQDRRLGEADQLDVERVLEAVVLADRLVHRLAVRVLRHGEDRADVEARGLPVVDRRARVERLDVADHLGHRAEAERGHQLAHLLGDELEERLDELGLAGEALAQLGVLGGDADRARVEVADAHHDAARHDERRGGEAELLGAEQGGDDDVAAGLQLAVGLHDDAVAQPVEQQRLLGLGEAELPRPAGVLERRQRAGAGAAVVAGDQHDVCFRLADPGRNGADTDLGDELDVHARRRVGVLEIVDQLLEVLDRVDVVVRRRADQPDTRRGVPGLGDPRVHLVAGELAALAGLGALGHLDLQVVGVGEVLRRDAEAARRHLLDGRAAARVVQAVGVLAALAGVRLGAEAVHRDGQRLVGLGRDRAVAHRPGREAPDDRGHRLDLVDRHRLALAELELEQAAQRGQARRLVVDERGSTGGRCRSAWPGWRAAA